MSPFSWYVSLFMQCEVQICKKQFRLLCGGCGVLGLAGAAAEKGVATTSTVLALFEATPLVLPVLFHSLELGVGRRLRHFRNVLLKRQARHPAGNHSQWRRNVAKAG